MTSWARVSGKIIGTAAVVLCVAFMSAQMPQDRVLRSVDDAQVVTLSGNVYPLAQREFDQGQVAPETPLDRMILELRSSPAQQRALDRLVAAQHDPQSPWFHRWLTPAGFGARFGVSPRDLERVTAWLKRHGFTVDEIPAGRRMIVFSGVAAQVEEAFHTQIHQYRLRGVQHLSNADDPQIPAALEGVVGGVVSLHNFRRTPMNTGRRRLQPRAEITSGSAHYLFPADYAAIYDLGPLYAAGTNGAGVSIAIVGRSDINLSDVAAFRSYAGLSANAPQVIRAGADPGQVPGDMDESTLDVEWAGAVAPGAAVKFEPAASTQTSDGVDLSAAYIVNHAGAVVMSTSYGSCEQYMGASELAFYNSLWQQAASEGISSFVSSGDSGASGCDGGSSSRGSGAGVNGLCSSPYSTCVGGTEFNEGSNASQYWSTNNSASMGSALAHIPETVWNESGSNGGQGLWGSGGGVSTVYTQPSWQQGVSGAAAANGMRAVPDVSLTAAGHDGYVIVENGSMYVIGGTSASSPSLAGMMALLVQSKGGAGQGNANAGFYPLVNAAKNPFHATPSGNNSVPGVSGFTASGAAYNLATGLGSVDAASLVASWGSGSSGGGGTNPPGVDFKLTASAAGGTLLVGKSAALILSVSAGNSTVKKVTLAVSAPAGVSVALPPSLVPGSPVTVTIAVSAAAHAGAQNIVFTATDASGSQTAAYALTVTLPPTLSIAAQSNTVSIVQGTSGTVSFTVATGGSFVGSVALTPSALPAGVTAAWAGNPVSSILGASLTTVSLTLSAALTARVGTTSVVVTAAGDGLKATQNLAVQVVQAPGIVLTASPGTLSMMSMATTQIVVTAAPLGGVTVPANGAGSSVSIVSGLPYGIASQWSAPALTSSGAVAWTLTLSGSVSAAASVSTLAIAAQVTDATSGLVYPASQKVSLTVRLTPPTLSVSPAEALIPVVQGATAIDTFNFAAGGSFHGAVTLSVAGLPPGVSAAWSANPVTLAANAGSSVLTLTATPTVKPATAALTITAIGGGLTVVQRVTMQVQYAPALQATLARTSLTMRHDLTGSTSLVIAPVGGLSVSVTLSVSALPAGVTAAFSPAALSAPGGGATTLTITGSAQAHAGTTLLKITATGMDAQNNTYTVNQPLTLVLQ